MNDFTEALSLNPKLPLVHSCHSEGRYKAKVQMHPLNDKNHSTINHTGHYSLSRQSRCPCKNGPVCKSCSFCSGCSCKCHQNFTLRHRFMDIDAEGRLLRGVEEAVGSDVLPFALETLRRLEFFRPVSVETGDIWGASLEIQAEQTPQNDSSEVLAEEQKVEQTVPSYKKSIPQRRSPDANTRTREHPGRSPVKVRKNVWTVKVTKTVWTEQQDLSLIQAQEGLGNNWVSVSKMIPPKTNEQVR